MRAFKAVIAAAGLMLPTAAAHGALASTGSPFMALGEAQPAPVGFILFCAIDPRECFGDAAPPAIIAGNGVGPSATAALSDGRPAWTPMASSSLLDLDAALRRDAEPVDAASPSPGAQTSMAAPMSAAPAIGAPTAPAAAEPLVMSRQLLAVLNKVNRNVNRTVRSRSDLQTTGLYENWSLPIAQGGELFGDCEDFALEKRHELIALGFPRSALSMAVVQTRHGDLHAVLLVSTDAGEVVLDSLSSWVLPWRSVGYRWLSRQVAGDSRSWAALEGEQKRG
jgi:predicted transglutaminase-like cysteine proteinase